jgi:hypothetical protein
VSEEPPSRSSRTNSVHVSLHPEEQEKALRFAHNLDAERRLTGKELSAPGERMASATDPIEIIALRDDITRVFYGGKEVIFG